MTRRRALDSVPWHYVVPHLLVCGSVTKPPSLQSGNRFPRVVIKAVTFHVTSYLDLWRLFLAGGGRHARISRLAPFIPIDYTRGWINWNRYSADTLGFPLFRSEIGTLCTLCIGYAVIIGLLSKAVLWTRMNSNNFDRETGSWTVCFVWRYLKKWRFVYQKLNKKLFQ